MSHRVEHGTSFTADRNLRIDSHHGRGHSERAEPGVQQKNVILLGAPRAKSQAWVHLQGGSGAHNGATVSAPEALKRQHCTRLG